MGNVGLGKSVKLRVCLNLHSPVIVGNSVRNWLPLSRLRKLKEETGGSSRKRCDDDTRCVILPPSQQVLPLVESSYRNKKDSKEKTM